MERFIAKSYGLKAEEWMKLNRYDAFRANGVIYIIVKTTGRELEELDEIKKITDHMNSLGDRYIATFATSLNGHIIEKYEEDDYILLQNKPVEIKRSWNVSRKLAKFHHRGRSLTFQVHKISRIGQWKALWERRLDQMENVWRDMLFQNPLNEFEKLFIESFPYYMGLAENAIQYIVDTEMDAEPTNVDSGTVCYERFQPSVWESQKMIRNPFDWVFDHGSRDLAEWTRSHYLSQMNTYQPKLTSFFRDYQTITVLSPFSWRLIYARLLFPLQYFDCVEGYYITGSEHSQHQFEERLKRIVNHSREYERFIASFYQLAEVPVRKWEVPEVGWAKV